MSKKIYKIREKELEIVKKREMYLRKRVANMNINPIEAITFIDSDGIKTVQKVNDKFFVNAKGKTKSQSEIVKDISAIASDFKSKYILL